MTKTRIDSIIKLVTTVEFGLHQQEKIDLLMKIKAFLEESEKERLNFTVTPEINTKSHTYGLILEWSKWVE